MILGGRIVSVERRSSVAVLTIASPDGEKVVVTVWSPLLDFLLGEDVVLDVEETGTGYRLRSIVSHSVSRHPEFYAFLEELWAAGVAPGGVAMSKALTRSVAPLLPPRVAIRARSLRVFGQD